MFGGSVAEHLIGSPVKIRRSADGDLAGQSALCLDWLDDTQEYVLQTVEGRVVNLPEAQLERLPMKSLEEGGFDAFWPGGVQDPSSVAIFAEAMADALQDRGYYVVQTCLSESEREEAQQAARDKKGVHELREELVEDVLGKQNSTKAMWLDVDDPQDEPRNSLMASDRLLTEAGLLLEPLTERQLGFIAVGRSEGLVRMCFESREEAMRMAPPPLSYSDQEAGAIEGHITWMRRRKVCFMHMLDNDGGDLTLFSREGEQITLPIQKNRLVMFRHDLYNYEYRPLGIGLAVQSWMMGPEPSFLMTGIDGIPEEKDAALSIAGPVRPNGPKAQIMSAMTRLPATACNMPAYCAMYSFGTDACTQWPFVRCEIDLYYDAVPQAGRSYTNHGSWMTEMEVTGLDNTFFGMSEKEAFGMISNQRIILEVGYQTLAYAGYTRESLNGAHIGVFTGDVGSDWHAYTAFFTVCNHDPDYGDNLQNHTTLSRLSYMMNMKGPVLTCDTACSASLAATHHGHLQLINDYSRDHKIEGALVTGVNTIGCIGFVGNCAANMLSHIGRCFTFDRTADGYQRGEGCATYFMKISHSDKDQEERLCCLAGTSANQDGRSASLTAPNGPSQQAVIKQSLRMSNITPDMVTAVECHGTGTALGDPIEVGALLAVMEVGRENPLPHTSAKSNVCHLEAAAGTTGLLKCINILLHGAVSPNCHIKSLNPHLITTGFPQCFDQEICDSSANTGFMGVSSFGFGGTNARTDVYGRAEWGSRSKSNYDCAKMDIVSSQCPRCMGAMCWRCGVAIPSYNVRSQHRCTFLRDPWADYEVCSYCYEGECRYGEAIQDLAPWDPEYRLFISGTWSAWSEVDAMDASEEDGVYTCNIKLGETRVEDFQILVNNDPKTVFYPVLEKGDAALRVQGPDAEGQGKFWRIDGREDGAPVGAIYTLTFKWGEPKRISWALALDAEPTADTGPLSSTYVHRYFLVGSWIRGALQEMENCSNEEAGLYKTSFNMGISGKEEFNIVRDRDFTQTFHPGAQKVEDTALDIQGPDDDQRNKTWLVRGEKGSRVDIQVRIVDGYFILSVFTESGGEQLWKSLTALEGP